MDPWRTGIVDSRDGHIRIRGYEVPSLMTERTFTDTIFLLHQGRLPSRHRARLARRDPDGCRRSRLRRAVVRHCSTRVVRQPAIGLGGGRGGHPGRRRRSRRRRVRLHGDDCRRYCARQGANRNRSTTRSSDRQPRHARREDDSPDSATACTRPIRAPRSCSISRAAAASPATASRSSRRWNGRLRRSVKPLPINIDGALAAVLHDMGFTPVFGRLVFIIGRVAGLTAEVAEELIPRKADAHPHPGRILTALRRERSSKRT